ncbi:magnesium transporter [Pseudomonas sp. PIC25]|uniref:magnesium transporter CorA family protein n=1 Tax=Pseudomonas sp. PIC25 TaxID=1958773 RepID=UPI000BABDD00|nr:magnesium transporter CorA family protein [Pseudomonas sp. PIC25]PAU53954.1 magnesium transporter [Pseudomonas sp. PIC25]
MISYYTLQDDKLQRRVPTQLDAIPQGTLWIDLLHPSAEEERFIENALGLDVPTREEMAAIEDSSRLFEKDGALYLTTSVVSGVSERHPVMADVSFVLTPQWLVTVRYAELTSFRSFETKSARQPELHRSSDMIFVSLNEGIVGRIADILEDAQAELNSLAQRIFSESENRREKSDLQKILKHLGRNNSLMAKLSGSLLSISRQNTYVRQGANGWLGEPAKGWLKSVERDVRSLSEFQAKMSGEITFLLDATLGLINIEQNSIIKVFSIAAVLFLPPTLVGTVYGMNFKAMPELEWAFGYPMALGMMVGSAALSYAWFKFKDWL